MAAKAGNKVQMKVVSTSCDTYIRSVDINMENDTIDSTAANATWKASVVGIPNWSLDANFVCDTGSGQIDDLIFRTILSGSQNVQVLPNGGVNSSSDNPMYRGEAVIKSYKISIPHDGLIVSTAAWEGNGTLNRYTSGSY
jgi:predicted secreted protein